MIYGNFNNRDGRKENVLHAMDITLIVVKSIKPLKNTEKLYFIDTKRVILFQ